MNPVICGSRVRAAAAMKQLQINEVCSCLGFVYGFRRGLPMKSHLEELCKKLEVTPAAITCTCGSSKNECEGP